MEWSKFPSFPAVREHTTRAARLYSFSAGVRSLCASDGTTFQVRSTWLTPNVRWRRVMKPAGNTVYNAPSERLPPKGQLGFKLRQGPSALEELLLQILLPCPCCVSEVSCWLMVHTSRNQRWWGRGLCSLIKLNSGDDVFLNAYPSEFIFPIRKSVLS